MHFIYKPRRANKCSIHDLGQRILTRLSTEFILSAPRHFSVHQPCIKFSDKWDCMTCICVWICKAIEFRRSPHCPIPYSPQSRRQRTKIFDEKRTTVTNLTDKSAVREVRSCKEFQEHVRRFSYTIITSFPVTGKPMQI